MRLQYIAHGAPECPLIRLFTFTTDEARQLYDAVSSLAKDASSVRLDELGFVEAVDGCQLTLQAGRCDQGLTNCAEQRRFTCVLTREAWDNVAGLIEPFTAIATGHQWLVALPGDIRLLLSPDGLW